MLACSIHEALGRSGSSALSIEHAKLILEDANPRRGSRDHPQLS